MRYDLELAHLHCSELGLPSTLEAERLEIVLGTDVVLCLENAEDDDDCLIGFDGTPWHAHGEMMFADGRGFYVEMGYLDVLSGLADGRVLVCELRKGGDVEDRWLIHRDFNDEFTYMEPGEDIHVTRAIIHRGSRRE